MLRRPGLPTDVGYPGNRSPTQVRTQSGFGRSSFPEETLFVVVVVIDVDSLCGMRANCSILSGLMSLLISPPRDADKKVGIPGLRCVTLSA